MEKNIKEFMVDKLMLFALLSALLYLLVLTVFPVEEWWSTAERLFVCSLPFMCIFSVILMAFRHVRTNCTLGDCFIALWAIYYGGRIWIGAEYPCSTMALNGAAMVVFYFCIRLLFACTKERRVLQVALIVGILLCGGYEAICGIFQLLVGNSRHSQYLLTGTFMNPGPYSAYLMLAIAICMAWNPNQRYLKLFRNTVFVLSIMVLPATWSRAAFVAVILLALWLYRKSYWRWRYIVWGGLLVTGICLYFLKQDSADGRLLIWQASLQSWSEAPLWGVGIGGFSKAYSDGIAELYTTNLDIHMFASAGVTEYAFNDLLKVLVEQGIVGIGLLLMVLCTVLFHLYRSSRPLFYGMLGILIFSMFSYPMELFPYQVLVVLIAAFTESNISHQYVVSVNRWWLVCCGLWMLPISFSIQELVLQRAKCHKDYKLFAHKDDHVFIQDFYELMPYEQDNPEFQFLFGKLLRTHGRFADSNAILRKGANISSDPMFHVLIGNNYKDLHLYEEAEAAYQEAFNRMPNRLYPLYQLMELYKVSGDEKRMREMAAEVIRMQEKITSPATMEMKEKANEILKQM